MSNRIFQSVIAQLKEATERTIGVIDADGVVVSCSEPALNGEKWQDAVLKLGSVQDGIAVCGKRTFKTLSGSGFLPLMITVGIGEVISCGLLGMLVYKAAQKAGIQKYVK